MFTFPCMSHERRWNKYHQTGGVLARILKIAAPFLVGSITKIHKRSIQSNNFVTSSKTGKVTY